MDDVEIAERNQGVLDRMSMAAQLAAIPRGEAATECEDCGDEIPESRRQAAPGCTRCISCQQRFERLRKERR